MYNLFRLHRKTDGYNETITPTAADQALHDGLFALDTPTPTADFDARVLAALERPAPWWVGARDTLKPVLSGAACSFVIGLLALHIAITHPQNSTVASPGRSVPIDMATLEREIDNPCCSTYTMLCPTAHYKTIFRSTPFIEQAEPRKKSEADTEINVNAVLGPMRKDEISENC